MASKFRLKVGNTGPSMPARLTLDGAAFDLTGATVTWRMIAEDGTVKTAAGPCVIEDALAGSVRYDWQIADTNAAGVYRGSFQVVKDGATYSFPNKGSIEVTIEVVGA